MPIGWTERRRTSGRWLGKGRAPRLAQAREKEAVQRVAKDEERRQRQAVLGVGGPSATLRIWAWPHYTRVTRAGSTGFHNSRQILRARKNEGNGELWPGLKGRDADIPL